MPAIPSRGFSLIEILLLLGLLSVVLIVALVAYPQVRDGNYVNQERQRLLNVVAVLRPLYSGTYATLTTDAANQARAFAPEANSGNYSAGQAIRNSWDGSVQVGPATSNPRLMEITYTAVPAEACIKLATGGGRNFRQVQANGTVVWFETMGESQDIPAVVDACNQDEDGATMVFQSR